MMEAYEEGFEILKSSPYLIYLQLERVVHLWNKGSVIRSWILGLLKSDFLKEPDFTSTECYVDYSGFFMKILVTDQLGFFDGNNIF